MVPCKSTAEEVSFEWSHHRISSSDLTVRTALHVSMIGSGSERVKRYLPCCHVLTWGRAPFVPTQIHL